MLRATSAIEAMMTVVSEVWRAARHRRGRWTDDELRQLNHR